MARLTSKERGHLKAFAKGLSDRALADKIVTYREDYLFGEKKERSYAGQTLDILKEEARARSGQAKQTSNPGRRVKFRVGAYGHAIRIFVGKYHVGTPFEKIKEDFLKQVPPASWESITVKQRAALLRSMKKEHEANGSLYAHVMSGGHGYTRRKKRNPKLSRLFSRSYLKRGRARRYTVGLRRSYSTRKASSGSRPSRYRKHTRKEMLRFKKMVKRSRRAGKQTLRAIKSRFSFKTRNPEKIKGFYIMVPPDPGAKHSQSIAYVGAGQYGEAYAEAYAEAKKAVTRARLYEPMAWIEPNYELPWGAPRLPVKWQVARKQGLALEKAQG